MKLRVEMTIVLDAEAEDARDRFRRLRRHAKRMGRERLAVLLLQALERDLGAGVVGFRLR